MRAVEHTAAKMLRKLFRAVSVFAILSVACFGLVLFFNKSRVSPALHFKPYYMLTGNDTLPWMIKERVSYLWTLETKTPEAAQVEIQAPPATNKTLELCPDIPPDLVGPLHVDFDFKRTLDDVRQEFQSSLQKGGRFKPSECISRHKVCE